MYFRRLFSPPALCAVLTVLALSLAASCPAAEVFDLPDGFAWQRVVDQLTGATSMAVAPDGRVFICEQNGALRVVKDGRLLAEPALVVPVDSYWERGLLGVALDPEFATNNYVYVLYVAGRPYPHHRLSRFTLAGDMAQPGSELVLLVGDDQRRLGGSKPAGHQGGGIHFGTDGMLYVGIGEQTAGDPAQSLTTFQGKLLRLAPDGTIPADNPFFQKTHGKYRAIWAYGLRNPFGFAIDPSNGRILINDVGGSRWEEIDEGVAGGNYGWPHVEGPTSRADFRAPIYVFGEGQQKSLSGGVFYRPDRPQFPREYVGKYFFAEYMDGWLGVLDPDHPREAMRFSRGWQKPVDLQLAPDGSLYVLCRNAWVIDEKFKPQTGALYRVFHVDDASRPAPRIVRQPRALTPDDGQAAVFEIEASGAPPLAYQWLRSGREIARATQPVLKLDHLQEADDGAEFRCLVSNAQGTVASHAAELWLKPLPPLPDDVHVSLDPATLPRRLSATGLFRSLADLTPHKRAVDYDVNTPLWSDGAAKRRWMLLPLESTIDYAPTGAWHFPPGTIFVKHFELNSAATSPASTRRLETRLLVVDRRGSGYGATYRWRADQTDADLLDDALTETVHLDESREQCWSYPSRRDCLVCHTSSAGFVLGVNSRQLNRANAKGGTNQLAEWSARGLFRQPPSNEMIASGVRLARLDDAAASLEVRVRSYLDANCSQCHRPGGVRSEFDARFETPLAQQKLIGGTLVAADLGIEHARAIMPGQPERSMIWQRMHRRQDVFNMPPLATAIVDQAAVDLVAQWIESLSPPNRSLRKRNP